MGYSPWGRKESDTIERVHFTYENTPLICRGRLQVKPLIWNKWQTEDSNLYLDDKTLVVCTSGETWKFTLRK